MASTQPPAPAVEANRLGIAALQANDPAAAAAHFGRAIASDPRSGALQRNLASAWRALGEEERELDALAAALAIDRRDLIAWIRKAERHESRAERGAALEAWSAALALAAQLDPVPDPLLPLLAHGQAFVAEATDTMFAAASGAIASMGDILDETDTRRGRAFVESNLGRRRIYRNECAGIYYPFLPADEFFDRRHFPWFTEIEAHTDAIRSELLSLLDDPGDALRPYVRMDSGTPDSIWTPLDNRLDWGACFLWEYGAANQVVLDRCPATARFRL